MVPVASPNPMHGSLRTTATVNANTAGPEVTKAPSLAPLIVLLLTFGAVHVIAPHLDPGLKSVVAMFVSAATVLSAVVLPALARN
jgi:hypothetical protein